MVSHVVCGMQLQHCQRTDNRVPLWLYITSAATQCVSAVTKRCSCNGCDATPGSGDNSVFIHFLQAAAVWQMLEIIIFVTVVKSSIGRCH